MTNDKSNHQPEKVCIDHKKELQQILSDMSDGVLSCPTDTPSFSIPIDTRRNVATIEVLHGIMVSQKLIDEAVRQTTCPFSLTSDGIDEAEKIEQRRIARLKADAELRADIDTSRKVVQSMIDRARDPAKFVSYDTMPAPLQRVIKAYMDAAAANKELNLAVAALQKDLEPPTADDAS